MHDVAASEPLRILERRGVHDLTGLQVDQVHDHGCSTHVDRDAKDPAAILVDPLVAKVDAITSPDSQWVRLHVTPSGLAQDLWLAAQ